MAGRGGLRAVSEAEAAAAEAARKKPKSLEEAIKGGVYLEILEAQQRQMAADIKDTTGPAKAAMYRQLALISKELEQLRLVAKDDEGGRGAGAEASREDEKFDQDAI